MKKENSILKFRHFKIGPIIGIGYWKDTFDPVNHGFKGCAHNAIIPFIRLQWGWLQKETEITPLPTKD